MEQAAARRAKGVVHICCIGGAAHADGPRHGGGIRLGQLGRDRRAMDGEARAGYLPGVARLDTAFGGLAASDWGGLVYNDLFIYYRTF